MWSPFSTPSFSPYDSQSLDATAINSVPQQQAFFQYSTEYLSPPKVNNIQTNLPRPIGSKGN
jgi:hypothetical protein